MYEDNHLARALRQAGIGHEDDPFLILPEGGATVTHGQFFANAERMAALLARLGVRPGDRVAVQAPKTAAMLELYVGCLLAGAVFLPLNTAYRPAEIGYFLQDAEPVLFVCAPEARAALAPVAAGAGTGHVLTLAADGSGTLTAGRDAEAPGGAPVPREGEDLAAILYTSGTTGRAKGAMLSHRALASNSAVLRELWRFRRQDVLIHALPVFHTHGLFVATNITLMAGSAALFLPRFEAREVLDLMPRASVMMGVPTFYTRLLELPGLGRAARGMRLFVSGSAPLLAETHARWQAVTGHAILERYGMTETNMTTSNPYAGERRPGSVGFPLPGVELRIRDAQTGAELPGGAAGVLEVRGPNLFSGYWKMPEKTAEELRADGFFITGDIARRDEDGYVHIVGRARDMVITGGLNVYPKEVESLIDALDGVVESAVIGVPHPDLGEAVVAVVVCDPAGPAPEEARIIGAISADLAGFKRPKRVIFVAALPRNTMGKVQKAALREAHAGLFA